MLSQVSQASKDYWIEPISFENVLSYIDFIFSPSDGLIGNVLEVLLIALLIAIIYISLKNKKSADVYVDFSLISMSIIFLSMITGIILSFLIRPIFISRYLLPCMGGLCLGFAILLSKCFDNNANSKSYGFNTRKIFYFGIVLILIFSLFSAIYFIDTTSADYNETLGQYQSFDSINDGRIVVFDDELSYLRYSPYLDKDKCILDTDIKSLDKYKDDDVVIFDKLNKLGKLIKTDYRYKKIFEIYQDEVYSFN